MCCGVEVGDILREGEKERERENQNEKKKVLNEY